MESLGEKLRNARKARNLDFDQVARETNIAARYIEALEAEIFDIFPGEPYLIGFLRTYGMYLDLDVSELLSLYRSLKIQEQPVPPQLLKDPSPLPKIALITLIVLGILGLTGGGVYFALTRIKKPAVSVAPARPAAEHTMSGDMAKQRFYRGDSILIPLGETQYKLELAGLDETVSVHTPGGLLTLDLGQEANIDLDNNGILDLTITAADFARNNPGMGALLHIEKIPAVADTGISANAPAAGSDPAGEAAAGTVPPAANTAVNAAASTMIFSSPNAYPFTLQSTFQGYCMFRWEILAERDRSGRNERFFQRADELNIQAQNGIRIWASNAQMAKLQVIGGGRTVPIELGAAGEVVVADIRWIRDEDNRYRLILARLESGND